MDAEIMTIECPNCKRTDDYVVLVRCNIEYCENVFCTGCYTYHVGSTHFDSTELTETESKQFKCKEKI